MDRRRYVRHPICVPVLVRPRNSSRDFKSFSGDLSVGGLSFDSALPLDLGSTLDVELPVHHTRFGLEATVASCAPQGPGFRIGLSFVEPNAAFKLKLAEQVLRIEELQATLTKERGAVVTSREAARVWVEQYAESFADLYR